MDGVVPLRIWMAQLCGSAPRLFNTAPSAATVPGFSCLQSSSVLPILRAGQHIFSTMATPQTHQCDCHNCQHDSAVDMTNGDGEKDSRMRLLSPTPNPAQSDSGDSPLKPWEKDPRQYYATQFGNMITISAFSGGVQVAVISFMNDLLSGDDLNVQLFYPDPTDTEGKIYSTYSVGIMLGLIGVVLNLTVAAIVALNAALAYHFTVNTPARKASIEKRIVFLMLLQFIAALYSGISLVLLCIRFDLSFTIVAAIFFLSAIIISAYDLIWVFGSQWLSVLTAHPQHLFSLFFSTAAFAFEIVNPSPASMFIISTYAITLMFHVMTALHNSSLSQAIPRRRALFAVVAIAVLWAGCVVATWTLRYRRPEGGTGVREEVKRLVSVVLAGVEALILLGTGIYYKLVRSALTH
ncbi:hypothetical protein NMY22_g6251 [Coprinellus aureogranulatus]|nr:hypothetical protein NMY22_g6251 [Coprinellus aureogranulatus]